MGLELIDLAVERRRIEGFEGPGGETVGPAKARILALIDTVRDPESHLRYSPGHLTASAVVLSPSRTKVLLVFHRTLGRWLQPGGHIDPSDSSIAGAARREAIEETSVGLGLASPLLVGLDVHEIPAARSEPAHYHFDCAFGFLAISETVSAAAENEMVEWCPTDRLDRFGVDGALNAYVRGALDRLSR